MTTGPITARRDVNGGVRVARFALRRALQGVGLLDAARSVRAGLRALGGARLTREEHYRLEFRQFAKKYGDVLRPQAGGPGRDAPTALVISCRAPTLEVELALLKTLQQAEFRPVVLLDDPNGVWRPYYELAGVGDLIPWPEVGGETARFKAEAAAIVAECDCLREAVAYRRDGIRTGQIATSTALRRLRLGTLDLTNERHRDVLIKRFARSLQAVEQARMVLSAVRPAFALFVDTEYSPKGELFDACLAHDVDVVAFDMAHCRSALMLKRYSTANQDEYLASLSAETWASLCAMEWTPARSKRLSDELSRSYQSGDWYGASWTQRRTHSVEADELRRLLGLDPGKKTAVVFAHILWDAPLGWARTLFDTYEDWLIETVRAACRNRSVNWVVKIHPANVGKRAEEGYEGEPAEVRAIRDHVGPLPPHVVLLPPDTTVGTDSMLGVTDYCLTVRGTVGIEAARLGIPVFTAAESRYSGKGFTIDSASSQEYLSRIAAIQSTPRLSARQTELADRFAYGIFVLRPFRFHSVTWAYGALGQPATSALTVPDSEAWRHAPDVQALARWFGNARHEDFLAEDGAESWVADRESEMVRS